MLDDTHYYYHEDGTLPLGRNVTFVFGSNLLGIHGGGAAKVAAEQFGAKHGRGVGYVSTWAYAIPTKASPEKTLPLRIIEEHVDRFLHVARGYDEGKVEFFVTRIGCGLAGYRDEDIARMFRYAPRNMSFAKQWKPYLETNPTEKLLFQYSNAINSNLPVKHRTQAARLNDPLLNYLMKNADSMDPKYFTVWMRGLTKDLETLTTLIEGQQI